MSEADYAQLVTAAHRTLNALGQTGLTLEIQPP